MDIVVPGTPEAIFNLMFTSGFWKEFATGEQVFMDIQMSDWQPQQPGSRLLMRNMTYLKPLQGPVDPKLTKCELKDEVLHAEFDDYVSVLTTVRTPNVPSAHMFVVKTRTCIMWAGAAASRLVVTTTVEWTGKSFFRSMIDQYTIDGQRQYYTDLEKAMRLYIFAHSPEFIPDYVAEDREALSWLESVPNEGADSRGGSPSFGYSHPIQPVEVAPLGELPSPALPTRQDYEILPSPSLTENTTIVKPLGVTPHNIHHSPVPTESSTDSAGNVAEGGSGDIWTGRSHNSGIKLAIKVLRLSLSTGDIAKKELKRTTREIYNWSKLDHENVNKLMGVIMFQERLGMVSEWMEQGPGTLIKREHPTKK
ncbi:hypothetical protein FRC11_004728 [Ceratobasidium sp. 423]|nr:hypothetical protein FRC11_004728 [Ceratobasidium sp. 423]